MKRRLDAMTRGDVLARLHAEMRAAVEDRDKARREADATKKAIRAEVRAEVVAEVRQLSLWQRLRLCFNPFGASPDPRLTPAASVCPPPPPAA